MKKDTKFLTVKLLFLAIGVHWTFISGCAENPLQDENQLNETLEITAREAYQRWQENPGRVMIIDVRTPEEHAFVGQAPMAVNIPFFFLKKDWYQKNGKPMMEKNADFLKMIRAKFEKKDTLFLMCRSGGRSLKAVNELRKAGFKRSFSISDGFEGGIVKDIASYFYGQRKRAGWKNSGAPWSHSLNQELSYWFFKKDESEEK